MCCCLDFEPWTHCHFNEHAGSEEQLAPHLDYFSITVPTRHQQTSIRLLVPLVVVASKNGGEYFWCKLKRRLNQTDALIVCITIHEVLYQSLSWAGFFSLMAAAALYFIFLPYSDRIKGMLAGINKNPFTSFIRNSKILVNTVFLGIIPLKT